MTRLNNDEHEADDTTFRTAGTPGHMSAYVMCECGTEFQVDDQPTDLRARKEVYRLHANHVSGK